MKKEKAAVRKQTRRNKANNIKFVSPYINIENPANDIDSIHDKHEIITPSTINVLFDYPLNKPVTVTFDEGPYTRGELAMLICEKYAEIYREESLTTTIPVGMIPDTYNRNETNGKYGIWGHGIGDLLLHTVHLGDVYTLGIDS